METKRMNVVFFANGKRIEAVRTSGGGAEVYRHGLAREPYGIKGSHGAYRCTDLDESLFRLGPEETRQLLEFLKD